MLIEVEKEQIKEQVKQVISYSQNIPEPKVDGLIDEWVKNKEKIYKAFGNKLIIESEEKVSFSLDGRIKRQRAGNFIDGLWYKYHNGELNRFLSDNVESFFDNTVSVESNHAGNKIPKGMKLVKAMKYFVEDKNDLNQIQVEASQLIQQDKVEGTLCLSIHPLDFLSSSENTYNWRSCHALDGEYRAGNLSYMTDSSTIICYLKGADDIDLPNFGGVKWNSKKWRMLMFLSQDWDMLAAGRQYPFASEEGMNIAGRMLLESLGCGNWSAPDSFDYNFRNTFINSMMPELSFNEKYLYIREQIVPLVDVVEDFDDSPLHYNDLLYSSCYDMHYSVRATPWSYDNRKIPHMVIGNRVKCLRCGNEYITSPGEDTMMCYDCEQKYGEAENDVFAYCDCCGARFFREEGDWVGEDLVCPHCLEEECFVCPDCGEYMYKNDACWDDETEEFYCNYCYNSRQEEKEGE